MRGFFTVLALAFSVIALVPIDQQRTVPEWNHLFIFAAVVAALLAVAWKGEE